MRQVKTEREVELLKIASYVTSGAHESIMQAVQPTGWTESDLESLFLYECYNCGLRFQAYTGIFGAGKNGAVLHYIKNDAPVHNGDMVLVDAAGEYRGYTSDLTRTFPSNGFFTYEQTLIYSTVLNAQKAAIEACAPGVSWSTITSTANRKLVEGLVAANILVGSVEELLVANVLSTFYPRNIKDPDVFFFVLINILTIIIRRTWPPRRFGCARPDPVALDPCVQPGVYGGARNLLCGDAHRPGARERPHVAVLQF